MLFILVLSFLPANICWSSRLVLKIYSPHVHRNNFSSSKTSSRHLEKVLEDVLETSWKTKSCLRKDFFKTCLEVVLETCLEDVFTTSWRQTKYLLRISVSTKSKSVSDKSISHNSTTPI